MTPLSSIKLASPVVAKGQDGYEGEYFSWARCEVCGCKQGGARFSVNVILWDGEGDTLCVCGGCFEQIFG